ncbi:hypothetical protein LEP1GSC016_3493 [Leptospira borgpetersenii serovar Hardjo-bovis str. Sponselee]|uniref:Uncharacterized protein n=4 Tax=Leptospira borgpetersenii TaxID=174 RepID=M3FGQ8_LEPBO|nr:hypothetical protein LBBP_00858 [Leptospira borgpetersenii serovar Ballum]EMG01018.1 hypothetical protein LEP1GSC123_3636 [Leptospira borgpetersenii str. 200701203]EMJ77058.1 hypothetical protein LEP1GSC016_3493 [Leptospira borgpetersenii serovar Hardjo-bovis str. Sponselee]EMK09380.1 hypothetical protein LEP1GSC066_1427 [Leptospira sp. serovar Kenya str. Sh9]EMO61842.1 hypothetical protein LEP1GSC133_2055 [Leptospira borgpetersenii serovar Pomona str. 200901868]
MLKKLYNVLFFCSSCFLDSENQKIRQEVFKNRLISLATR